MTMKPLSLSLVRPTGVLRPLRFGNDGRDADPLSRRTDEFTHERLTRADETPGHREFLDFYIGTESNPVVEGVFRRVPIRDLKPLVDRFPEDSEFMALELATRYQNGSAGAPQDLVLAEHYYEVSAATHSPVGQYYLGLFLMHEKPKPAKSLSMIVWEGLTGERVATQNEIMGYAWLTLAATKHYPRKVGEIQSAEKELLEADRWMSTKSRRQAVTIADRWYQKWLAAQK